MKSLTRMESFMKHLKAYMIISALSLMILLSACTKIDISTGIDTDFTAYLSYNIEIDVEKLDFRYHNAIKRALNEIGWYYQEELGFGVQLNIETNPYSLVMTRRIQNNSFEQAYKSLESLLINEEITPFMTLDMAFQTSERQSNYIFSATTDIPFIMSLSNAEELSPMLQQQLADSMNTGEGTITLSLPAGDLVDSSHQATLINDQVVMIVPLSFTEETGFELIGSVTMLRDGTPGGSLYEIIQEQYRLRGIVIMACIIAFGLLIITILIVILTRRIRTR